MLWRREKEHRLWSIFVMEFDIKYYPPVLSDGISAILRSSWKFWPGYGTAWIILSRQKLIQLCTNVRKNFQVCTLDARNHSGRLLQLQCVFRKWWKMLFPFWTTMNCKESFSWVTIWGVKPQCSLQCSFRKGSRNRLWLILRLFKINIAKKFLN